MAVSPIEWKIINRKMITENVLELTVEFFEHLKISPWQWVGFLLDDENGKFARPYSIAYQEWENDVTDCVFLIKILESGRWTKIINSRKIGDKIKINWVFGNFGLKSNDKEKLFIATWTWIVPIINMLQNDTTEKKTLLFGVQYQRDILWEDKIKKIPQLKYKIFLSREEVPWYEYWRIDINAFDFDKDIEIYICWAPPIVKSMREILQQKWYSHIYSEEFF
jgi:NAD(P)H-flavin reductase